VKQLTKKRKIEIADALINETEFADAFKRHRAAIRELIVKAIEIALSEADDKESTP
jgi:hypothetical protein